MVRVRAWLNIDKWQRELTGWQCCPLLCLVLYGSEMSGDILPLVTRSRLDLFFRSITEMYAFHSSTNYHQWQISYRCPQLSSYYLGQKSSATYGTGPFIDKIMSNLLSQTPKHYLWPPPDMMTPSALCAINLRRPWRHSFMPSCHTFFLNFFHFFFQWRIFFETMSFPSKASYRNELGPELKLFCSRIWNP